PDSAHRRRYVHRRARLAAAGRRVDRRRERASLLGLARHRGQQALPGGLREGLQPDPVLLFGELLHGGPDHRRGGARDRRQGRGPRRLHDRAPQGADHRRAARPGADGRLRQPDAEHLYPQGRACRRQAPEHRHPHVSGRQPVLEVQPRGIPETAGVLAGFPALPALLRSPTMAQTTLNGIEIDYAVSGRGRPVILSHGYGATGRMWDGQRRTLGDRYRLITWDMRGHGQTESPNDPAHYSTELTVGDIHA